MKPDNYPAEPAHLWQHFYEITRIPRPSRQEAAVRDYVIGQAEALGHGWRTDDEGNLMVSVPARVLIVIVSIDPCGTVTLDAPEPVEPGMPAAWMVSPPVSVMV